MHDGWYLQNGKKVIQQMNFPQNHPDHPNEPKGVKAVLTERGLYQCLRGKCKNKCELEAVLTEQGLYQHLRGKCKNKCELEAISCCNRRILELQPDFKEQKSLVQEVIEAAGHLWHISSKISL
jgi:hypothetical protein